MNTTEQQLPQFEATGSSVNGRQISRRQIGTYHHTEPDREYTQHFECAAWYRAGAFPAGDYPVYEYRGEFPGQTYVLVHLTGGVVTAASFRSRLGASYGSDRGPNEVGTEFSYSVEMGSFRLPDLMEGEQYTFLPGIGIDDRGSTYADGRPIRRAFDPSTDRNIGR